MATAWTSPPPAGGRAGACTRARGAAADASPYQWGLSLTSSKAPLTPDQSFSALKQEHNQTLHRLDLKKAFRLADGRALDDDQLRRLMEFADTDGNQKISFKE
jgi:hypothetical protein